jgi:hypothetical protein
LVEVSQEEGVNVPAGGNFACLAGRGRFDREATNQDGKPSERELASPKVREVDVVEALKIGLYRVGVLGQKRDERR